MPSGHFYWTGHFTLKDLALYSTVLQCVRLMCKKFVNEEPDNVKLNYEKGKDPTILGES
jgi:hypothetical protein